MSNTAINRIIKLIKSLFHTHSIVWTSRKYVSNTTLDFTTAGFPIDIQPAKQYIYEGYCYKCGQKGFISKITVADIFDKEQPYDNGSSQDKGK